jgi:hypothetical protein
LVTVGVVCENLGVLLVVLVADLPAVPGLAPHREKLDDPRSGNAAQRAVEFVVVAAVAVKLGPVPVTDLVPEIRLGYLLYTGRAFLAEDGLDCVEPFTSEFVVSP